MFHANGSKQQINKSQINNCVGALVCIKHDFDHCSHFSYLILSAPVLKLWGSTNKLCLVSAKWLAGSSFFHHSSLFCLWKQTQGIWPDSGWKLSFIISGIFTESFLKKSNSSSHRKIDLGPYSIPCEDS